MSFSAAYAKLISDIHAIAAEALVVIQKAASFISANSTAIDAAGTIVGAATDQPEIGAATGALVAASNALGAVAAQPNNLQAAAQAAIDAANAVVAINPNAAAGAQKVVDAATAVLNAAPAANSAAAASAAA